MLRDHPHGEGSDRRHRERIRGAGAQRQRSARRGLDIAESGVVVRHVPEGGDDHPECDDGTRSDDPADGELLTPCVLSYRSHDPPGRARHDDGERAEDEHGKGDLGQHAEARPRARRVPS